MIRSYLIIALRNLLDSKLHTSINILGLSLGIAYCLVLTLFVLYEINFDTHHKNAAHIYRVVHRQTQGNQTGNMAMTQQILGVEVEKQFAEVLSASRVSAYRVYVSTVKNEAFEEFVMAVDPSFFDIFTFHFAVAPGSPVLTEKTVLISEAAAVRHFGKRNPIGETITVGRMTDLKVTGVYKNIPAQSHLKADIIFSWMENNRPVALSWASNSVYNYVMMDPRTNIKTFNMKMNAFVHQHTPANWSNYQYFLQPLLDIHTDDSYSGNPSPSTGKTMIVAFGTVGVIILLLACINYMNMATARSAKRALEVGVRKVMGAHRGQLIRQFLMESFLLCTFSFLLAILWADLTVPLFNNFLNVSVMGGDRDMQMADFFSDYRLVSLLVFGNILIALVAGSYPSLFLSRFIPALVLKGRQVSSASKRLRRFLVAFQFAITGILVIMALVVFKQIDYIRSKDLGYNKDQMLLFVAVRNEDTSAETFKAELTKITGIKQITTTSALPGRSVSFSEMRVTNTPEDGNVKIGWILTDHDYIPTLQIALLAGRNFRGDAPERKNVILNEMAARALGWSPEDAIGKRVSGFMFTDSLPGEVIGVIKDYHTSSLRKEIAPLVLIYNNSSDRYLAKVNGTDVPHIQAQLKEKVTSLIPGKPFESYVLTDYLDLTYQREIKTGQLLTFFTGLALVIGCLGLYALSAYETEQRIKELGIRKIMGASSIELLIMLSRNFLKPVLVSFVIAMPLAYWLGKKWLQGFPYHTALSWSVFLQSALYMIILGWVTIAVHGIRSANLNPADSLRQE